jgi:hypothetical protein
MSRHTAHGQTITSQRMSRHSHLTPHGQTITSQRMSRQSPHSAWADNHLTAHEQTLWVRHPFLFILLRLDQDELKAVAGQVPLLPALR